MKIRVPSWEGLTKIGKSKAITFTIFVPVIGYMILFNEQLVHWFELSKAVFPVQDLSPEKVSTQSISRLYCFYFGLTSLGAASAIYQLLCPELIKQHGTDRMFIVSDVELMTRKRTGRTLEYLTARIDPVFAHELEEVKARLKFTSINFTEEELRDKRQSITDLMLILWRYESWSSPLGRAVVCFLYVVGFSILAIPTIDTFVRVFAAFARNVF